MIIERNPWPRDFPDVVIHGDLAARDGILTMSPPSPVIPPPLYAWPKT